MKKEIILIFIYFAIQIMSMAVILFIMIHYNVFRSGVAVFISVTEALLLYSSVKYISTLKAQLKAKSQSAYIKQQSRLIAEREKEREDSRVNLDKIRSEIDTHIHTLKTLDSQKKYDELSQYISRQTDSFNSAAVQTEFCSRPAVNAALCHLSRFASQNGVRTEFIIQENINLPDLQLCIILLNLIENAVEAAKNTADGYVYVRSSRKADKSIIKIENSASVFNKSFATTKKSKINHGLGIGIVKSILKEYGGDISYSFDSSAVTCIVIV